jgi:hypothetical protein
MLAVKAQVFRMKGIQELLGNNAEINLRNNGIRPPSYIF